MTTETIPEMPRTNGAAESTAPAPANAAGARVVSDPNEIANIVLMQIDAVNDRKNDLTISVKGLTDLAKQLTRVYGEQIVTIRKLQARIHTLETQLAAKQSG